MWMDIFINNESYPYEINEYGVVRNSQTKRILKSWKDTKGYPTVKLYKNGKSKTITVHILVASHFNIVRYSEYNQVNHIDGDKSNNHISNLEWCSGSMNVQHAFNNNLKVAKKGHEHPNNKFDEALIHKICELLELGSSGKEIKRTLGIKNKYLICNIRKRKYWRHISDNYNF